MDKAVIHKKSIIKHIRLSECYELCWGNDKGTSKEIALEMLSPSKSILWRISLSEVYGNDKRPSYQNMNRYITILNGEGLKIKTHQNVNYKLDRKYSPYIFDGKWGMDISPINGKSEYLNILSNTQKTDTEIFPHLVPEDGHLMVDLENYLTVVFLNESEPDLILIYQGREYQLTGGDSFIIKHAVSPIRIRRKEAHTGFDEGTVPVIIGAIELK